MSGYDGSIRINTQLNTKAFSSGVKSMMSGLSGVAKTLGLAFSAVALVKFGKEAIELASNIAEVDNVVSKSFGNMRGEMDELAKNSIKSLGMSQLTAYKTGSTFMSMGKSMLDSTEDAKTMALELTKLTGNMSSFYNVSQDLASIALKSIYTGETETLKQYGVVMTEVNLKQFALSQGIKKAYSEMTQSEKVMLRYKYVMSQLSFIGDDFLDTQDSWANQTRILSEQWKEFLSIIGSGLITVLTPAVKVLNSMVSSLISIGNTISSVLTKVFGMKMQSITQQNQQASDSYEDLADSTDDYTDAINKANKANKNALASFDSLETVKQEDTSSTSSSSGSSISGIGDSTIVTEESEEATDAVSEMYKKIEDLFVKIKEAVTPTIDAFKRLYDEGLSKLANFSWQALKDFYNKFLVPVGEWVLGVGLPTLIDTVNDLLNKIDWDSLNKNLGKFWDALAKFTKNIGQGLINFWKKISPYLTDAIALTINTIGDALGKIADAILDMDDKKLTETGEKLGAFLAIFLVVDTAVKGMTLFAKGLEVVKTAIEVLSTTMENSFLFANPEMLSGLIIPFEKLTQGTFLDTNTWEGVPKKIDDAITKAFTAIGNYITEAMKNILTTLFNWDSMKHLFSEAKEHFNEALSATWEEDKGIFANDIGKNIMLGILDGFAGAIAFVLEPIQDFFLAVVDGIMSVFDMHSPSKKMMEYGENILLGVIEGFKGKFIEFKKSIQEWYDTTVKPWFTKDKWNFGGVEEGMRMAWQSAVNSIKNIWNKFADWINDKLTIKIDTSGLIGKGIAQILGDEIKLGHIPKLANGAVIKGGSPFLAVLGDQKQGQTNIETPLDTMIQAFKSALYEVGYNSSTNQVIQMNVDGQEFARLTLNDFMNEANRQGYNISLG